MLTIKDLQAETNDKTILKNLNLSIQKGDFHVIMGPNGAGKSTLSQVLLGNEEYNISKGKIEFQNSNLLKMDITERALNGLFVVYQNPIEIPGLSIISLLKSALNARQKFQNLEELDTAEILIRVKKAVKRLKLPEQFYTNFVNSGLSGGQKKLSEILQMYVLNPKLAIIDEIDSGLDVDSLKLVASGINQFKNSENSILMITHYQRILEYLKPDFVHILVDGQIVETGNASLALEIEKNGYKKYGL